LSWYSEYFSKFAAIVVWSMLAAAFEISCCTGSPLESVMKTPEKAGCLTVEGAFLTPFNINLREPVKTFL